MEAVSVADGKSRLSELLSRIATGERFQIHRLAAVLGQDEALLAAIERGEVHKAMAAFGLWRD